VDLEQIADRDLLQWRSWAVDLAMTHSVSAYEVDWLLQTVTDIDRLTLQLGVTDAKRQVRTSMPLDRLSLLWLDRIHQRQPIQYLVGKTYWRDFEVVVSPAVLIPRPETESIIDLALAATDPIQQQGIWVDLGTGSGAIAIGLAKTLPNATIYAVDCSSAALNIAQTNATNLQVLDRIDFRQGSWWSAIPHLQGKVAAMISNPPYIPSQTVLELQPEVVNHEPHLALDGGEDGLAALRILAATAPDYLVPGGIWLVEMMAGQGEAVRDLLVAQNRYMEIEIINDLAGLDRFVLARVKCSQSLENRVRK
jgi:release factor glutamine methyltransferase